MVFTNLVSGLPGILFYGFTDAVLIIDHIRAAEQCGVIGYAIVPAVFIYIVSVKIPGQRGIEFECNFLFRYCKTSF